TPRPNEAPTAQSSGGAARIDAPAAQSSGGAARIDDMAAAPRKEMALGSAQKLDTGSIATPGIAAKREIERDVTRNATPAQDMAKDTAPAPPTPLAKA